MERLGRCVIPLKTIIKEENDSIRLLRKEHKTRFLSIFVVETHQRRLNIVLKTSQGSTLNC